MTDELLLLGVAPAAGLLLGVGLRWLFFVAGILR